MLELCLSHIEISQFMYIDHFVYEQTPVLIK